MKRFENTIADIPGTRRRGFLMFSGTYALPTDAGGHRRNHVTALSRLKQGFESLWERHFFFPRFRHLRNAGFLAPPRI